ncbi:hypothetical protein ACDA63_15170 [Uliginosibacterium sp. sgz301328]|uniref:type IV pilus modification PilV family protein n=1 Tax=Uliginosibacterium sp. sgz301328 TaxID=3243764 RepID=UPI00359E624E
MIEVLVALVLVTSVGVAIVMWAENGLHSVGRLRAHYQRTEAARTAQSIMRTLPDARQAQGELEAGGLRIKWKRETLGQGPQTGYPRGFGTHDVLLFKYRYEVLSGSSDEAWFEDEAVVVTPRLTRTFDLPK